MRRVSKDVDPAWVEQAEKIEALLHKIPSETLGARLARARQRLGLSVRDLAASAGVNKNSVLRLERGGPPHPVTVVKLCKAMNLHAGTLLRPAGGQSVAIHRHEDDQWYDMTDFASGPVAQPEALAAPILLLTNRLDTGRLLPNVIELYGESPRRSHVGEEVVYVVRGTLLLTVGNQRIELNEGESATFWSSEPHTYAPGPESVVPTRIFSVTLQSRSYD